MPQPHMLCKFLVYITLIIGLICYPSPAMCFFSSYARVHSSCDEILRSWNSRLMTLRYTHTHTSHNELFFVATHWGNHLLCLPSSRASTVLISVPPILARLLQPCILAPHSISCHIAIIPPIGSCNSPSLAHKQNKQPRQMPDLILLLQCLLSPHLLKLPKWRKRQVFQRAPAIKPKADVIDPKP